MRLPAGARLLSPAEARVLAATVAGARTVRAVASAADVPLASPHAALLRLRTLGLVAWADGLAGTLRPLVRDVTP